MATQALGAIVSAAVCLAAAPYLARLTLSVPDRADPRWWRGRAATRTRAGATACVAAVVGALAGAAAHSAALLPAFVALALAGTPLIVIDVERHRLPNRLTFAAAGAGLLLGVLAAAVGADWSRLLRAVEAGLAVFAALLALRLVSPRSFGYGDVKLGGVVGGYLGWFGWTAVLYGVFAGFLLGALASLALIGSRRASLKSLLAFGPALLVGPLIVLAWLPGLA